MYEKYFRGLFDSDLTTVISVTDFLLCVGGSLVLGLLMAFAYMVGTRISEIFAGAENMVAALAKDLG